MTRSFGEIRQVLGRIFWIQWILANSLGAGVGLALPIVLAEFRLDHNYSSYGVTAFMSFGIWVGLSQWLLLRQVIPISAWWIGAVALPAFISLLLVLPLAQISILLVTLVVIVYPLLSGLSQWWLLRQILKPSWGWIITNFVGMFLGGFVGGIVGVVSHHWSNQLGLSTLIGALVYGFVYSVSTIPGLRRLMRKEYIPPVKKENSGLDAPPNSKLWVFQIVSALFLFALISCWQLFFQSLSISPFSTNISRPLWLKAIYPLLYIFFVCIYLFLSILIHELGHFLFGAFNGFDLKCFAVGRWVIVRRGQRMKFGRTRRKHAGGFIQTIPKSPIFLNKRLFMMILGGPVGSFLLFCVGVIPLLFPKLVSEYEVVRMIAFLSIISLYMAIFNAIPLRIGYLRTDGGRMLDLIQNNLEGQRFVALYGVAASLRQGTRPRDIDPMLVEQLLAIPEKSTGHVSGLLMAYSVALDKREFEQAGNYLDQALDLNLYYPELHRGSLILEGAYFEAHIRRRVDLARQWFDQIKDTTLIEPYSLLRAEAALLLAEGDRVMAQTKAEQGLALAQRDYFMVGSALAENEYLLALLQQILPSAIP
jgi:hypothetical protein